MVCVLQYPFEFTPDGKGDFETATQLRFVPPTPRIDTLGLAQMVQRGLRSIALEQQSFLSDEAVAKQKEKSESLELGDNSLPSLHIQYKDSEGDEEKRKELIQVLEKEVAGQEAMLYMSDSIDLTHFASAFGRLMVSKKQCFIGDSDTNLTPSIWADKVMPRDKVRAALRYCCFFGIISSMGEPTGLKQQ